ncbi:MAG TPA: hypothetical protein VEO54_17315 [Thermoanaerobaculia bacterium]|nr:hypothetical protein [Thermoanaerobaculia bacterium]
MRRLMLVLLFAACYVDPATKEAVAAAKRLTRDYARPELQAYAAGHDCKVLVIESETPLDTVTIESMQYGTGEYGAHGGVEQFAADHRFYAVVYRDPSGVVKSYDAITRAEAESMTRCR